MGHKILRLSVELLTDILKGLQHEGRPTYFQVTADPLPADAKVVGVGMSDFPGNVDVTLASDAWDEGGGPYVVEPKIAAIDLELSMVPIPPELAGSVKDGDIKTVISKALGECS